MSAPIIEDALKGELKQLVSTLAVSSILRSLPEARHVEAGSLDVVRAQELLAVAVSGVRLFNPKPPPDLEDRLRRCITAGRAAQPTRTVIYIRSDHDVLTAQTAAQRMMKRLFKPTDCIRVATAVSELTRNIYMYAGRGQVTLELSEEIPGHAVFSVVAEDKGTGIKDLASIMDGTYRSTTGLGRGLRGAKSLLDSLTVDTGPTGTTVRGSRRTRSTLS